MLVAHVHKMTRLDVGPPKQFYCEIEGCDHTEEVPHNPAWDLPPPVSRAIYAAPVQVPVAVAPPPPHQHNLTRLDVGPPKRFYCEVPGCDYTELVHPEPTQDVTQTVAAAAGEVAAPRSPQPERSVVRAGRVKVPPVVDQPPPTESNDDDEDEDEEGEL